MVIIVFIQENDETDESSCTKLVDMQQKIQRTDWVRIGKKEASKSVTVFATVFIIDHENGDSGGDTGRFVCMPSGWLCVFVYRLLAIVYRNL